MGSIKFVLRPGEKKAGKEYSIYIQYIHKGEKCLLSTDYKSKSGKDWNSKQGKPNNAPNLEKKLNALRTSFRDNAVARVEGEPEAYRVKEAWKEYLDGNKDNLPEAVFKNTLLARWQDYLVHMKETLTPRGKERTGGTIRNNINSLNQLKEFLASQKRQTLKPEKFTQSDYQKFDKYLVAKMKVINKNAEEKEKVKAFTPNSISKIKKHFKSFLKWHIKNGGLIGFNIEFIEYAETEGIKIALTEKELTTIAQSEYKGGLNLVRDLLVLQASTGVRVSDLQRLCENFTEDKSAFKIKVKKTGKFVLVPVLPLAKEVLIRNNYSLPHLSEQKYRVGIKAIYQKLWPSKTIEVGEGDNMKKVFIHEEISSHDMVRTFVNIAAKKGITVPTIATITGKSIQVLLKNYLSEDKDHAAQELLEKFDLSPLRIAK
jgi:site-specific recombinase XerD